MTVIGHCVICDDFTHIDADTRLCDHCEDREAEHTAELLQDQDDALSAIGRHLIQRGGDHHAP